MGRRPIFCFRAGQNLHPRLHDGSGRVLRDKLDPLLRPVVESAGCGLWEIEYSPGRGNALLRLYIDSADGITVEDCERVSRAVSEALDAADPVPGHYTLEVSSPGIERPLRTAQQFAPYVGEKVFVEMVHVVDERRRFKGPLVAADAQAITVEVDGRRHVLPLTGIRKAHLAPDL
jgi:ribosome maturation factor RimP